MIDADDQYLTPDSVQGVYPTLTKRWLARRRWAHLPPTYVKAGKRVLYRRSDLETYLSAATCHHEVR